MKYDAGMMQFHDDIVAAIKDMIHGENDKVAELTAEISPVPLREYLRNNHGKCIHGGNRFECMSSCMLVVFDHTINNSGEKKLQLSWSQVTSFIRKYPAEIFNEVKENEVEKTFSCDDCGYDKHGCCNYPDTPDNYCVMEDKKIPVAPAQTDTTATSFDYSELDSDTAAKLENVTSEIFTIRKEYVFTMAKKVAYAHDLLANHYGGKFGLWCESIGISRDTGNNLVRVAEIFGNITSEEQENLSQLKPSLLYEASKPSAPPELVEQVKSGYITTHKEYIGLKKQLEAQMQRYSKALDENHSLHSENQSLRRDRANAMNRADEAEKRNAELEKYDDALQRENDALVLKKQELEQHVKELESRPVDVMVQSDTDAEKKFNETIRKINLDFENFRDEADKDLADMRNQRNAALDRAEAAEAKLNAPKAESNVKPFVIRMTMDDFSALIEAVGNNSYLKNIIQKAQVLRI